MTSPADFPDRIAGLPVPTSLGECQRVSAETRPDGGTAVRWHSQAATLDLQLTPDASADAEGPLTDAAKACWIRAIDAVYADAGRARVSLLGRHLRSSDVSGPEFLRASFVVEDRQPAALVVLLVTRMNGHAVVLRAESRRSPSQAMAAIEAVCDAYSALLWPGRSATQLVPLRREPG